MAKPTTCPTNSVLATNTTCTCNSGYKPNGNATACVLPNVPEPAKNTAQPCTNTPASTVAATQQNACTNPVNSGTGNKYQREVDYAGVGTYPLNAERIYNSGGTTPTAVELSVWGSQWRGAYDRSIAFNSNGTINITTVKRADGKQYYFNLSGSIFVGDADVVGTLVRVGVDGSGNATGWTYKNEFDEVESYDANGKLISITNRQGQTQTLTYSDGTAGANGGYVLNASGTPTTTILPAGRLIRVTDPAGRTLQFGYDTAARVVKMTDPASGITLYIYSGTAATDNLTTVTYPDGKVRTYLYAEAANVSTPNAGVSYAHSLTGIVDENSNRYASWTYDAAGRAKSSEHGALGSGIDHVGLVYGTPDANGNSTTTVTDVMGVNRNYGFVTTLGVVKNTGITGQPCNGCSATFTYDTNGNVASRTDFNGNRTCYAYDLTRNLETVRVEGLASGSSCPANLSTYVPPTGSGSVVRKITTQWHASLRLPSVIAEALRITTNTYDVKGNLLLQSIQPTTDTTGGSGIGATAVGSPRITSYTYNTAGQVLTADGARTDVNDITIYAYDTQGNLVSVSNALSQVTTLSGYDANGRPGTLTDPNGLITTLSYDARGRLLNRSTGGESTTYTYDGVGNLTSVTLPAGAAYTYTYDAAHRLTQIADIQNNKLVYTLDAAGNRTQERLYDSANNIIQTHSRVFDTLSRLYQDIGALNQITTYAYDANGNLTGLTDPLNRLTSSAYDALNRLITNTDPATGITRYGYNALDQLTQVTDPRNLVTQYTRDGLNNLNQTTSPDTGISTATYDTAGNLLSRTDAKGQTATYTYDALNRITGISYSGGSSPAQTVSYQYDQGTNGLGHLTQITDVTGTTTYSYDVHGRLLSAAEQAYGASYTTTYAYDVQGRLKGITYPSGRSINYTFDSQGRVSQIATTLNAQTQILASNISYRPFGDVQSFTYGDGQTAPVQTYTRQFDQDGRINSYTLNGQARTIGYDAASQITLISDPTNLANNAAYNYDTAGRLTSYAQGSFNQGFGYDPTGNRTSQLLGSTNLSLGYATNSNRLSSVQVGSVTPQSVTQDANGATTSDGSKQYGYDLRGRLIQTITPQGAINYEINALGLRVRKQVPYASTDTLYHYDASGHLIAESPNASATYTREYIYLGDLPVAVMQ